MNIALPAGRTLEEVVDLVISMGLQGAEREQVELALAGNLGLSPSDAALAWDRVNGGVVRASTQRSANCPDRDKDPLAWLSYQRARQDKSIIAGLNPQYVKSSSKRSSKYAKATRKKKEPVAVVPVKKPWWKFW